MNDALAQAVNGYADKEGLMRDILRSEHAAYNYIATAECRLPLVALSIELCQALRAELAYHALYTGDDAAGDVLRAAGYEPTDSIIEGGL